MKNKIFICSILILALASCKDNKGEKTDPTKIVVPSNSDATNPSLADTAYNKNDSIKKKDSSHRKQ